MKKEHILYRLKRARETFDDAVVLFERGSINSCVNRLYYAAFYGTIALLLNNGIEIKSHNGVKQKLGEEFILKGLISKELGKMFGILSDYRHKGDYDDLFNFDPALVSPLFDQVRDYINRIEEIINS